MNEEIFTKALEDSGIKEWWVTYNFDFQDFLKCMYKFAEICYTAGQMKRR